LCWASLRSCDVVQADFCHGLLDAKAEIEAAFGGIRG
jgi:hypothetical protein